MKKVFLALLSVMVIGSTFATAAPAMADGADTVVNTIEGMLGTNSCTVSAVTPTRSGQFIFGDGSMSCNRRASFMAVEVCLETSANGQPNTWAVVGVCGVNQSSNVFARSATGQTPCEQTPMWFRTRTVGEAMNEGADLRFTGTIYSTAKHFGCL